MQKWFFILPVIIAVVAFSSCKKDKQTSNGAVTDVDGNGYDTVHIGTQVWLKQNLKTAHYRNGDPITEIEDSAAWFNNFYGSKSAAWCSCNGNAANNSTYGKLYNWYVVTDPRQVCPAGWHTPGDTEWHTLALVLDSTATWFGLGGDVESEISGGAMKAVTLWSPPNTGATNSSGFTAFPAGNRYHTGGYHDFGSFATFWSSTAVDDSVATCRSLGLITPYCYRQDDFKGKGFSIRCVKD